MVANVISFLEDGVKQDRPIRKDPAGMTVILLMVFTIMGAFDQETL